MCNYTYFWSFNPSDYANLTVGIVGIDGKLFFPTCRAPFFRCGASRIFCGCLLILKPSSSRCVKFSLVGNEGAQPP